MANEQVSSIVRSLTILECFADADTEWTLKALVSHLEMPTTTVFRQLSTLVSMGYLVQDPIRKSYQIGPRLLQFCSVVLGQCDLRAVARPELESLSVTARETINLCQLIDFDIYYLDKVETFHSVACNTRVGSRVPAHITSAGKVLLSAQSDAVIEEYCALRFPFPSKTAHTITDAKQMRQELALVRKNGYAIDNEEIECGLTCVAAPLYDLNGNMPAAVSIAGPTFRMSTDLDAMIHAVRQTALRISRLLGHRG